MNAVKEIKPFDLIELMADSPDNFVIIDVREEDEYRGDLGHIPGSKHIPLSGFLQHLDELEQYKGRNLVFICNSGERSRAVCQHLKEIGYPNLFNLYGGMIQWHLSGLDVEYE
ncbi:MAG: rhodanese-like domain-containing protein [Thermoplasmataceae archaeon]